MKLLIIIGTRPEAIKMAPLIILLKKDNRFVTTVCITSQHKEMLVSPLNIFGVTADYDLKIMEQDQDFFKVTINILKKIKPVILNTSPDMILVQGDTMSAFVAALAGFYSKIRIAHIEAGLRTNRKEEPYPEEISRQLISRLADLHFAPTLKAKQNLISENIPESMIHVTGNTVTDALHLALEKIKQIGGIEQKILFPEIPKALWTVLKDSSKKIILVTAHRRENIASGITNLCLALREIARHPDVVIVIPVHPNPNVKNQVEEKLANIQNIFLLKPLDYLTFVYLMKACYFIITDSGGIQEEAPCLAKPVLLLRDFTEREESVKAGTVKLVGTTKQIIEDSAIELLTNDEEYKKRSAPGYYYGEAEVSKRIIEILAGQNSSIIL